MEDFRPSDAARLCAVSATAESAWQLIKDDIRRELGDEIYRSYIEDLELAAEEHGVHVFHAPNGYLQAKWASEKLAPRLRADLSRRLARPVAVEISTTRELSPLVRELLASRRAGASATPADAPATPIFGHGTLKNFCEGPSNAKALMMARMIAGGRAPALRMVLIHGSPGIGKSHLCEATANAAVRENPHRKVVLFGGQRWVEEFVDAAKSKRDMTPFKAIFKDASLLIIDDVQRIAGKVKSEEELFDTIAAVMERGGQVMLTALTGASELTGFGERLQHHLRCASECEIKLPEHALRREILRARVAHYADTQPGFDIESRALDMIADRMAVSGRELDGAVRQLMVEWMLTGQPVTVEMADAALRAKQAGLEKRVSIEMIKAATAKHFDMSVQELLRDTREICVAYPRQIAFYLSTKLTTQSLPGIARLFGGFDHTTVLHARKKIVHLLALHDAALRGEIQASDAKTRRALAQAEQAKADVEAILRALRTPV